MPLRFQGTPGQATIRLAAVAPVALGLSLVPASTPNLSFIESPTSNLRLSFAENPISNLRLAFAASPALNLTMFGVGPPGPPGSASMPSSTTDGQAAVFTGTTGQILRAFADTGLVRATGGVLAGGGTVSNADWSGTDLAIENGGTGQSTASAAFSALKQDATTSATGVVELATDAETLALADTSRVVTPSNLGALVTTDTQRGINRFSTDTEAEEATSTTTALTPAAALLLIGANLPDVSAILSQRVSDVEVRLALVEEALAESLNTFLRTGNGWVDPYDDSTGIDGGASSNFVRQSGYTAPNSTAATTVAGTTIFSGSWSSTTLLRDGAIQVASSSANKSIAPNTNTYIGYQFSSATQINQAVITSSSDVGFVSGQNPLVTINARLHTGMPTTSNFSVFGADLGTQTVQDLNGSIAVTFENLAAPTMNASRLWFVIKHAHTTTASLRVSELAAKILPSISSATLTSIALVSSSTITHMMVTMWIELIDTSVVFNTDFTVEVTANNGTNWTALTMVDQSTAALPGGNPLTQWRRLTCDFTAVGVSGLAPRYRWKNPTSKMIRVHQTRVMWK